MRTLLGRCTWSGNIWKEELIVVIVVLGILAALAVPSFTTVKDTAADKVAFQTAQSIARAAEAAAAFGGGHATELDIDNAGDELTLNGSASYSENGNLVTVSVNGTVGSATISANANAAPTVTTPNA